MDPYLYQYAIGGAVFGVGLFYAFKQGYLGFEGRSLRNLLLMIGGLAFFMILQGYIQYAPMSEVDAKPFDGGYKRQPQIGTGFDYGVMIGYFVAILAVGTFFGRRQKTTKDFFFGGQRFSWWLIAFSLIATTIGSYSFVKYSQHGVPTSTASPAARPTSTTGSGCRCWSSAGCRSSTSPGSPRCRSTSSAASAQGAETSSPCC